MSDSNSEKEENNIIEEKEEEDRIEPVPSDDEDDCEGYFLEPTGNNVNIAEKIAEANKRLFEEEKEDENRPRKVQFSEDLVDFEPYYYSDEEDTELAQNSLIFEEELETKEEEVEDVKVENEPETIDCPDVKSQEEEEEDAPEDIPEDIPEEINPDIILRPKDNDDKPTVKPAKFVLVLLPKEQNSSCESVIGEEIPEETTVIEEIEPEPEKPQKPKIIRPKSAKKSWDVSKISPNLNYSSNAERKSWQTNRNSSVRSKAKVKENEKKNVFLGEIKVQIKGRLLKKINIGDMTMEDVPKRESLKRCANRPRSWCKGKSNTAGENRPKSAPSNRTCCVIQTELPQYNGLRSEYGLSAEQLKERKQKSSEIRKQKKVEKMKKKQEEIRRKNENEETFQKWLFNKTRKPFKKKSVKVTDTLTRSDIYIQTHASYAANRNVPYSLDYSISKKFGSRKKDGIGRKKKTILAEKLFGNMTPHFKRSFNIYLGVKS